MKVGDLVTLSKVGKKAAILKQHTRKVRYGIVVKIGGHFKGDRGYEVTWFSREGYVITKCTVGTRHLKKYKKV